MRDKGQGMMATAVTDRDEGEVACRDPIAAEGCCGSSVSESVGVSIALDQFAVEVCQGTNDCKPTTLLQPITALIPGGEMFAILGGSGSGKTTLLNAIAGRCDPKSYRLHGRIVLGRGSHDLTAGPGCSVACVTQDDFLHPFLTVRETLEYTARLKIPACQSDIAQEAVKEVIVELGLKECADSLVGSDDGSTSRGISGGEKRRVSIALQILTHPEVLAADEPTSGLDAFTAITVMECLQRLTVHGTTVVCSIHQPRSDIFALFHSVLLLSAGGQAVYCGRVDRMLVYFAKLGHSCPHRANPADYFVDLTAVDTSTPHARDVSSQRVQTLVDAFQQQQQQQQQREALLTTTTEGVAFQQAQPSIPWSNQVRVLAERLVRCMVRDRSNLAGSLLQALIEGIVIMAIFWRLPLTSAGISSRSGVAYITASCEYYILMIILIDQYCTDLRRLVDRELQDGLYHPSAYYTAHWVVSWPIFLCQSAAYSACIYFGCGLRGGAGHYLLFFAVCFALAILINTLVWVSVSLQRDFAAASLIGNMNFTFLSLTAGFLVNLDTMPVYVKWVQHISFLSYAYRLIMTNEFSHRTLQLEDGDGLPVQGVTILHSYGVAEDDYLVPWLVMGALAVAYVCAALLALSWLRFPPTGAAGGVAPAAAGEQDETLGKELRGGLEYEAIAAAADAEPDPGVSEVELDCPNDKPAQGLGERLGLTIDIVNLSLTVNPSRGLFASSRGAAKMVLRDVTASLRPGRLVGVMGGSGSGKTTLLSLLANRVPQSCLSASGSGAAAGAIYCGKGRVLFGGRVVSAAELRRLVGFVQQFDFHLPSLSVLETLQFHAQLRLRLPTAAREGENATLQRQRVREVMKLLDLNACAHVCVGDEAHKGISGGEKRRLSIAIQLLNSPMVLLLDEVTTGLDAFTARKVVALLRSVAQRPVPGTDRHRTVVLSIHQPRYDVFACFDEVVLLSRGLLVWAGDRSAMALHFEAQGHPFPAFCNPADFLLDVSSIDFRGEEREAASRDLLQSLSIAFAQSLSKRGDEAIVSPDPSSPAAVEDLGSPCSVPPQPEPPAPSLRVPFLVALPLLLRRASTNLARQPALWTNRISQGVFFALILAAFYAPLQNDQAGVQNRMGCLYELTALCFIGMLSCIAVYPQERDVFYREYPDGYYSAWAFAGSYLLLATPFMLLTAACIALLVAACGLLPSALATVQVAACMFSFLFVGECLGVAFCSVFQQIGFSVNIMSAAISFLSIMAGFMSLDMPEPLAYLALVSPQRWGAFLMANIVLRGQTFSCATDDVACLATGEEVLEQYGLLAEAGGGMHGMRFYSGMLLVVCAAYLLAALLALRARARLLSH